MRAQNREKLLRIVWDDFLEAWTRVETNANKLSCGVLQVLFKDLPGSRGPAPEGGRRYEESPYKFRSISPYKFYPLYRTYDNERDLIGAYRSDPGRLVADLEEKYGVKLQAAATNELHAHYGLTWEPLGMEPAADVFEFWSEKRYIFIARTNLMARATQTNMSQSAVRPARKGDITDFEVYVVLSEAKNKEGIIPFFILSNLITDPNRDPTFEGTMSDIDDIAFLNEHYNHIASEEAEEVVTNIHRMMTYKSPDHLQDMDQIQGEPGTVVPIGDEEDLAYIDSPDEVPATGRHLERLMQAMTDISFMGDVGFGRAEQNISGMAGQIALQPQNALNELKLPHRIRLIQKVIRYMFMLFENRMPNDAKFRGWLEGEMGRWEGASIGKADINGQYFSEVVYGKMVPRDDTIHEQNVTFKHQAGLTSLYDALDEMGDPDPDGTIARIKEEMQDPVLNPQRVLQIVEAEQAQKQMGQATAPPNQPNKPAPNAPPGQAQPGQEQGRQGGPGQALAPPGGGEQMGRVPNAQPNRRSEPTVPGPPQMNTGNADPATQGNRSAPFTERRPQQVGANAGNVGVRPGVNRA